MTARMYYDNDADPAALDGQTVAIIGYGRQGHAHARNLHDPGVDVVVGLQPGSKSRAAAAEAGLRVADVADAVKAADVIMIARAGHGPEVGLRRRDRAEPPAGPAPDVRPRLQHPVRADHPPGDIDVGMVAPKGPGHLLRSVYEAGGGVPALFAVEKRRVRAPPATASSPTPAASARPGPASSRRRSRRRPRPTSSASRRSCAAASRRSIKAAFETLVEAGYQPELAYFETMHELKLIVDLMYRGGLNFMRFSVSDTAEYGDYVSGPRITEGVEGRDEGRPDRHPERRRSRAAGSPSSDPAAAEFARLRAAGQGPPDRAGRRASCAPRWRSSTRSSSRPAQAQASVGAAAAGGAAAAAAPAPAMSGSAVAAGSVRIFDTTLRDGEQAPGAGLTAAEKLEVARQLARLKVDVIEAGFPAASPGDFEAVRRIAQETKGGIAVAALARCRDGDPQRAVEAIRVAERPHLHVFIATSDIHLKHKLRIDRDDGPRRGGPLGPLRPRGARPRRRDRVLAPRTRRGPTPTSSSRSTRRSSRPARRPSTSPTRSATRSRASSGRSSASVVDLVGRDATVSVHCHNDLGLATANTLAAVQAGARQVEVTINGLGERAGNASLEEVVMALRTRPTQFPRSRLSGVQTEQITAASRLVSYLTGFAVQPNKAIVGGNAFAHESGIHQDGVIKNPLTYEIMTPQSVGLTGSQLTIGKLSGRRGLQGKLARARPRPRGRGARRDLPPGDRARRREEGGHRRRPARARRAAGRRRSRQSVELVGWSVTSSHGGNATGRCRSPSPARSAPPRRPATARSTRCSARSTRRSSRSSAGIRC